MKIQGATVLVTGGNRGLGRALVQEFLDRGAKTVYAGARNPTTVTTPGASPLPLDVTDRESIDRAAAVAADVDLLVNNAAIDVGARSFVDADPAEIRREFDTNFFGPIDVVRAFVPVIARNGGGHVLNVASVLAWLSLGGSYSASKAALWSMTNALRTELAPRQIGVTGLYVGYIDTDLAARVTAPKSDPRDVARAAVDGIEAGAAEVLADDITRTVKSALAGDPS